MDVTQVASNIPEDAKRLLLQAHEKTDPLAFLFGVWVAQPDGFFCVVLRPLEPDGWHDVWFEKRGRTLALISDPPEFCGEKLRLCDAGWDTYFSPVAYERMDRKKEFVLPGRWLFADLDYVPPHEVPMHPTFAWTTSPGKYQAIWYLERELEPREFDRANKAVCGISDADPGTWNRNRLLRVPGSHHLKAKRAELNGSTHN